MEEQRNGLLLLAFKSCFLLTCLFAGCAGDVPDGVVYTDLHKTIKKGDSATLKCEFRGEPIAVYWKKEIGKDQWTDLVTWVEGTMRSGSCSADDSCEMNQDYSLIINNVRIADRGRYMCKISNYLGILIDNYTDVSTYAPPEEPYPIIQECTSAQNSTSSEMCSIPANDTSMDITCSASSFFPNLNLFFLHGSIKISNTGSDELTNEDGTKNISIWIKGSASEKPYVCVASDIPGSTDERTAIVFLRLPTVSTPRAPDRSSYPSQTTMESVERIGAKPAKIVVPIFIITLVGGTLLIVYYCLKHRMSARVSGKNDAEETQPMLQIMKVHVKGMVSYYELWSLAYNTSKEDMGKVWDVLKEFDVEISTEEMRREQVYDALCRWKEQTKKNRQHEQAQIFRDALDSVQLERRWQQIYEERRQTTARISERTLEQILLDLNEANTVKEFISNLISDNLMKVVIGDAEAKSDVVSDPESDLDNAKENTKVVLETKTNVGGEDERSDLISETKEKDGVSSGEKNLFLEAMGSLKEWKKGPFSENPFVLLSLALEKTGCTHQSKTFFDGTLSFYELRSLLFNMDKPSMKKLSNLIKELGEEVDLKEGPSPQRIFEALCRWKEQHNKGDQSKILRDALERAELEEEWLKIPETRKNTCTVSESTLKHILLEIRDPNEIQQFIGKLIPGTLRHQNASDDKDVIQQAMETLRKWSKGPFDENPMILLSRALESGGCNPVDRTFFYGTISYFELWSLVHAYKDDVMTLCNALHALRIQDVREAKTLNRVYLLQLFEWKNQNHACDQLLAMKLLLFEARQHRFWEDVRGRRFRNDTEISDDTLEHILWHVQDPNKINNFLLELTLDLREPSLDVSKPARYFITAALNKLKQWKKATSGENHVVQVSLALERAKCTHVDRTFFIVPTYLQAAINDGEVEGFVRKLTSRHCKRLTNSLPRIDEKRVLEISDENNEELFDTKSMISDWIASEECSNYEKRCKLDDSVINIGRHDMADTFRTISYRRETEGDLTQPHHPHPTSEYLNHDRIFDDDLISLAKLMSCLGASIMSQFCTRVGISDQEKEAFQHGPVADSEVLRNWRDSNLTSKSPNCSLESVFLEITDLMGNSTNVNCVTDDELGFIETQLRADDKEKLLSGLHIRRDKKGKWTVKVKRRWLRKKQKLLVSNPQDEETGNADEESVSEEQEDEVEINVPNIKDSGVGSVFVNLLKEWRKLCDDKSCRKKLRTVLKTVGVKECIANETPRIHMYKAELVQVAFNILMRDVLPVIEALRIDQRKTRMYRRQNPHPEKGSLCLLIQRCQGTTQMEAYNRLDFLPILLRSGFIDVAKSLYLDYEQSLSELSSIASRLHEGQFKSFIKELGISPDELTECSGPDEEAYRIEVMRIWKSKIRPVPYHYRMHIVTALQTIGCGKLAGEVLSGLYRQTTANDNVIRAICSRLDAEQIKRLCDLLKLKPDMPEEHKRSTATVVRWVNNWMKEYDPFPKVVFKGKSLDKFQARKHMNNELVKAGYYELANEIMMLEFSRF